MLRVADLFLSAPPARRRRVVAGGLVVAVALATLANALELTGAFGATAHDSGQSHFRPHASMAAASVISGGGAIAAAAPAPLRTKITTGRQQTRGYLVRISSPPVRPVTTKRTDQVRTIRRLTPTTTTIQPTTTTTTIPPTTRIGSAGVRGRSAGLIQAGDSKVACISDEPTAAALAQDLQYTGIEYNCIETFTDADPTWADWVSPWIASSTGAPFVAWVAADPTGHSLIDTQNLIPDSEASDPDWTAECAAGDFNIYASEFATNMVAAGLGYTVIRLGHEMNGNWYNDSLGTTVAEWQQWAQCFAQEVTAMRAVPGCHFLFDWNVNANYRDIPLADFYPGDAYVDIIGIDQYDGTGVTIPPPGPTRFAALAAQPEGLDTVEAFAAAHGKPLSIPEWGTTTGGPNAGGDDPYYVEGMAAFIASHDVAYQSYFNADVDGILPLNPSVAPLTVAAYTAAFG